MDGQDIQFEDPYNASYNKTSAFSNQVMEQFKICHLEGSKEMTSGGLVKRFVNGQIIEMMLPDQRQIFANSVRMLRDYLYHHLISAKERNEEMYTIEKKYKNNLNRLNKQVDHNKLDRLRRISSNGEDENQSRAASDEYNALSQTYNNKKEELESEYYQDMLRVLGGVLHDKNYFQEEIE